MSKCYIDITLLPSADISLYFLWSKVYQQLHLALVEIKDNTANVGVSFPDYDSQRYHLGNKLRIIATSTEIELLDLRSWLSRLTDYVHITSIRKVPDNIVSYAYFKRLHLKSNSDNLARRRVKRKGVSEEEAIAHFKNREEVYSRAPFIRIVSQSTKKRYRLLIVKEVVDKEAIDSFTTYGLSSTSTVPLF